jgi:hypothetical protein
MCANPNPEPFTIDAFNVWQQGVRNRVRDLVEVSTTASV